MVIAGIMEIAAWSVLGGGCSILNLIIRELIISRSPLPRTPHEYGATLLAVPAAAIGAIISGIGSTVCLAIGTDDRVRKMGILNALIFCVSAAVCHRIEYSKPRTPAVPINVRGADGKMRYDPKKAEELHRLRVAAAQNKGGCSIM